MIGYTTRRGIARRSVPFVKMLLILGEIKDDILGNGRPFNSTVPSSPYRTPIGSHRFRVDRNGRRAGPTTASARRRIWYIRLTWGLER